MNEIKSPHSPGKSSPVWVSVQMRLYTRHMYFAVNIITHVQSSSLSKKILGMLSSCMPASLTILAPFLVSCQGKERPNKPRLGVPNAMQLGNWISHLPFNLVALVCHGMTELAARSPEKVHARPGHRVHLPDAYPGKSPSKRKNKIRCCNTPIFKLGA